MTSSLPRDSTRQGLLEEVLGEYMQRLDRGETVDREALLARHPEVAEELRSYFFVCDELERARRRSGPSDWRQPAEFLPSSRPGEPCENTAAVDLPRRVGDYDLLEQIGEGGMGVIYRARQRSLQRLVALKMIRTDRLSSQVDALRLRGEAEAAASLDHPNIVPIYEVGEHQGQPFSSMKLIDGGGLHEHLSRLAPDLRAGVGLLAAVARAVHYAHQRGILHRDLKPANILLELRAGGPSPPVPYVTDFGLAKRLGTTPGEPSLTQKGVIVGTPNYMAPEQATRAGVSTATDVYSLGAVLYELLTGRPPFRAETALETLLLLVEQEPAPPRGLNRRVDQDLETVCLKCLRKEPHQRYASALALADDLERWLRGEPVLARPVGRRERALKWVRRRPALAALAALLVLVSVAGLAGVVSQWRRAEGESDRAAASAEAERRTAYARAVALAYAEWRVGNAGRADQVLGECLPELRGWEWHYLRRLFGARQLATFEGHGGVRAVAFSPDGARVASAGDDGAVRVWDRRAAREVLSLGGRAPLAAVAFSPDGKHLAAGADDGTVRVWDAARGTELVTWCAHAGGVTGLAFDPAGRRLASTGGEPLAGELKLWGPATGKALARRTWENLLAAVAFSPDGRDLATAGHDGRVTAWDSATLEPVLTFKGQTQRTVPWTSVEYSADGRWLAAGSSDGLVRVWDAASGQELFGDLTPDRAGVSGLAFGGRDGRILAAATADNIVRTWVTRSGMPAFTLRGHTRAVRAVACSPDGRTLASGSLDRTVRLWDINPRDEDLTLRPANEGVTAVAFSHDGARLAAATRDRAVKVWDVAAGRPVMTLNRLPAAVHGLAFGPGGELASAGGDGVVRVWEVPSGREKLSLRCRGPARAVAFGSRGELASAGGDGAVRVWEVPSGREKLSLWCRRPVHSVAFSPDGRRLAAGEDGVARVWDAATGRELLTLGGHTGPLHAVAFSPDGGHLATADQDEVVRVWDAATGELALTLRGHAGAVHGLAYGPGGRLASVGDDRAVRLWDAAGHELLALRGHTDALRTVAFSPDGHRLASAGNDGTVKVWDGTTPERAR